MGNEEVLSFLGGWRLIDRLDLAGFEVEGVFYSPTVNGLAYRGHYTHSGPPAAHPDGGV